MNKLWYMSDKNYDYLEVRSITPVYKTSLHALLDQQSDSSHPYLL